MPKIRYGPENGFWRGGRSIASNGYVLVRVGVSHHLADCRGYAYEHRLVAEEVIGRRLEPNELVHHRDGNKQNNDPANLQVVGSIAEHSMHHRRTGQVIRLPGEPNVLLSCACGCGQSLLKYDSSGRLRRFISGHNTVGRKQNNGR